MKATMVLTPLALAMAAVLSVSAYAGNEGGWHPPKPNPQSNNKGGATALWWIRSRTTTTRSATSAR